MKKKNIGLSFDSWLREEGIYEEVTTLSTLRKAAAAMGRELRPEPV
jgi:hypothetical protein